MIKIAKAYNFPVTRMLKIGGKEAKSTRTVKGKTFQKPVKFDKFRLVYPTRDKNGNYVVDNTLPASNEVNIIFPFSRPADVFMSWLGIYDRNSNIYVCRGDGENCSRYNRKDKVFETMKCPCEHLGAACKPRAVLYFQLPEINDPFSVTAFKTTSWNSIKNIDVVLNSFYKITGDLRKIKDAKIIVENRLVWHNGLEVLQPIVRITSEEVMQYLGDRPFFLSEDIPEVDDTALTVSELNESFDEMDDIIDAPTEEQAVSAKESIRVQKAKEEELKTEKQVDLFLPGTNEQKPAQESTEKEPVKAIEATQVEQAVQDANAPAGPVKAAQSNEKTISEEEISQIVDEESGLIPEEELFS